MRFRVGRWGVGGKTSIFWGTGRGIGIAISERFKRKGFTYEGLQSRTLCLSRESRRATLPPPAPVVVIKEV